MKFNSRLTKGLSEDQKKEFVQQWTLATNLREKIVSILQGSLDQAILESESGSVVDCPNYLAKIADLHGYRRGLRQAIKLISDHREDV